MRYLTTRLSSFVKPVLACRRHNSSLGKAMEDEQKYFSLSEIVGVLEEFAPLSLAESWDNVGLLIEPSKPRIVKTALVVNDLTERVLDNAIKSSADLIISYHPPIFAPMKRISQRCFFDIGLSAKNVLTGSNWKDRIVTKCLENQLAVYSPHTAWDSIDGGINDWLCSVVTGKDGKCVTQPVSPNQIFPNMGAGRIIEMEQSKTLQSIVDTIKTESKLPNVQIAIGVNQNLDSEVRRIALCAGSGASVLKGVAADLYVTGEMSHHEVLDAVHRNVSVVLMNHSNSERGFFETFRIKFYERFCNDPTNPKLTQIILDSEHDKDPLTTH
ncbi:NIF3-like protein 1 [Pseudolycoriella hygida]|uniref:NIF3-like protein 1 n=1 Tax=Pseudolycoriella hygida TaxID=35572 RepID=A0A9Q0S1U0_9DIPT|nr:NIF3-like protein 1 [Pseudolycoriella hygida]